MAYQVITDFKGGLDARKFFLSQPPGTLTKLVNAHITQGGEIEKRKAFLGINLPAQTFGFQETLNGIVVFGSRDIGAAKVTFGAIQVSNGIAEVLYNNAPFFVGDPIIVSGSPEPGLNGTFIITSINSDVFYFNVTGVADNLYVETDTATLTVLSPIIYQKLTHPNGANMTGIVCSACYDDITWSVSSWDNGDVLEYYGSDLITDFTTGLQSPINATPFQMANNLCDLINATGNYTTIKPILANLYMQVTGGTSGLITIFYDFQRVVQLTPNLSASGIYIAIEIPYHTSNDQTALDLKTAIEATTDGSGVNLGFTATVDSNKVTITSPVGISDLDMLLVGSTGDVTTFVPTPVAVFDVLSIPDQNSANPFNVSTVVQNANLTYKLVSNGIAATAPSNATGQFSIIAGTPNAAATGSISLTGTNAANNETLMLGEITYTFVTTLTGTANQILIGATGAATLSNLVSAINGTSGSGSTYSIGTVANVLASAAAVVSNATVLTAIVGGTSGNSIALSTTSAALTVTAFSGGGPDTNQITQITVGTTNLLSDIVPFNKDAPTTANDVVAAINDFQGTSGFSATANGAIISLIANVPGTTFNEAAVSVQCAGNVCIANCTFSVLINGGITNDISIISANGTNLLSPTPITYQESGHTTETLADFCGRVVANINSNTVDGNATGYLACSISNQIWVSKATVSSSDDPPDVELTGTVATTAGQTTALTVTLNTTIVAFVRQGTSINYNSSPAVVATVNGGIPSYTYNWKSAASNSATHLIAQGLPTASWHTQANQGGLEQWYCQITGLDGKTIQSDLITLILPTNL